MLLQNLSEMHYCFFKVNFKNRRRLIRSRDPFCIVMFDFQDGCHPPSWIFGNLYFTTNGSTQSKEKTNKLK